MATEAADEREREADEVMRADEFVKVDGEAGRDNAEVGAEVEGGGDAEGGLAAVRILESSMLAYLQANQCQEK